MLVINDLESARLKLQSDLDAAKTQAERNHLGQFATPSRLAEDILEYAHALFPTDAAVRFLDPAIGTGAFYSALLRTWEPSRIVDAQGYEIDPHYGLPAVQLWAVTPLRLYLADFTRVNAPPIGALRPNLLICNPPYVRHHHLPTTEKHRLHWRALEAAGVRLSGLAGLYCYFLCLSHTWLAEGGLAGWLIPSEFMDVNYGREIKRYLLDRVTLLRIHRFAPEDVQFGDALVSSAIVWYRNATPLSEYTIELSYGGTLTKPQICTDIPVGTLRSTRKWTRLPLLHARTRTTSERLTLSDLFDIKRGVATGANNFFIVNAEQVAQYELPSEFLQPILPSPHCLAVDEVESDASGEPVLDPKLYLVTCNLSEPEIQARYPSLWVYLQYGRELGIPARYLCSHRSPWYAQESRPPAMFLCTYMGRQSTRSVRPFRFILNHSRATAPNVYLMLYPKRALRSMLEADCERRRVVWQALNAIEPSTLVGEGRVYGGGLYKMEPRELANTPAHNIIAHFSGASQPALQMALFTD